MRQVLLLFSLIAAMTWLSGCNVSHGEEPTVSYTSVDVPFTELVPEEPDPAALNGREIASCRLSDLPAFHWKEVDAGLVDIRTPEAYSIQTESLYQEGYLGYRQARVEEPDRYQSIPEMSYEAFLATCNVFPSVDFKQYSVLGAQATGTGCTVTFEKHVYRDDQSKTVRYENTVIEEGACETVSHNRNLILVPRIPSEYDVEFLISE